MMMMMMLISLSHRIPNAGFFGMHMSKVKDYLNISPPKMLTNLFKPRAYILDFTL